MRVVLGCIMRSKFGVISTSGNDHLAESHQSPPDAGAICVGIGSIVGNVRFERYVFETGII